MAFKTIMRLSLYLAVVSPCSIQRDVVHDVIISDELSASGWTPCYDQPYSHLTKLADLSACDKGSEYWVFVGAKETSSSATAYMGAYGPSNVLTTTTSSTSVAYNPNTVDPYHVYWYNYPGRSFGFTDTSEIYLANWDRTEITSNSKLSWMIEHSEGGFRAGKYNNYDGVGFDLNVWRKIIYYKHCPIPVVLTAAVIYAYEIKQQLELSSSSHDTSYGTKSTIRYDIEQIQDEIDQVQSDLFDIKLLLALKANETIDELKEYLDALHSRVQLRPTSYPSLSPTADPTSDPTTDPTIYPTSEPTVPTTEPTADPTSNPTTDPSLDPTTDPTSDPTYDPTADPSKDPTADPSIDPTTDPTTDPTLQPTAFPSAAPTQTWLHGLTLHDIDNMTDIGAGEFNSRFQDSECHIIRRVCDTCEDEYREMYYRRFSAYTADFEAYEMMTNWSHERWGDHENGYHFNIYSNITDALTKKNAWRGCYDHNPADGVISGFGDCFKDNPRDVEYCQYSSNDPDCNERVKFSIFVGEPSYYGVDSCNGPSHAISNEKQNIADINRQNVYEIEDDTENSGNLHVTINAEQIDLIFIGFIGFVLILMNGVALRCGCCKCDKGCGKLSNIGMYKFKTVKCENNLEEQHDLGMEIEETDQLQ